MPPDPVTGGLVDFAASDAFLSDAQIAKAGGDVLHLPLTLGPVAITYHLPGVRAPLKLDGPILAAIYRGKITTWNDRAIAALNRGVQLPSLPIVVAHRADGSGTTFIFTNYLGAVSRAWKSGPGAATVVSWPVGTGARGTAGVAAAVKQSPGGIGYVELSYAVANHLPVAAIKNAAGRFVAPSVASAAADAANAPRLPADLRAVIVDEPGATSYPITGFSWGLIHQKAPNGDRYAALLKFLWWCIHNGQQYADRGGLLYAPLPAAIVKADEARIMSVTYNGEPLVTGH